MASEYTVYGDRATGSAPIEAALTLIGAPYVVVDGKPWASGRAAKALARVNPMGQIPALILPDGEVMTESAAILTWLADTYPNAHLSPPLGHGRRAAFLRWMSFVSSAIYALYWVGSHPRLLAEGEAAADHLVDGIKERIAACWRMMDSQVAPCPYLLGEKMGVLDLYVAVVSRWAPWRKRFYLEAPKMADMVRRVDAEPRLAQFWASRFPFDEGWEEG